VTPNTDEPTRRFDPAALGSLGEPVRRYLGHALRPGAPLRPTVRLTMAGRIKVGAWLPFSAEEELDGRSFRWSARVEAGRLTVLRALDRFADGEGRMEVRPGGRLPLIAAHGPDTDRSAAARAAVEAIWSPAALLPQRGVRWSAQGADHIVAAWPVPPEHPEVHLEIDAHGAVRSAWVMRWRSGEHVPCGATVHAEERFGDVVVPSRVTVAWGFGTPDAAPFFEARVLDLEPVERA
jgi:hypothetical protein